MSTKDSEVLKDIELSNTEEKKPDEPSDLEKRIKMTRQQKREKAQREGGHDKFEDEDDRDFDSQGLQNQQHGENVFYTLFPSFSFKSWTCFLIIMQIVGCLGLYIYVEHVMDKKKVDACPEYYTEQQIRQRNCLTLGECAAYELGGRYTPALTERYQYHRLFTSLLIYDDSIQLFMNVFTFMIYGFICENYYGGKRFVFVFFSVGVIGNLFGLIFKTDKVYAGASSSTYGMYEHYNYMGEDRKTNVKNFVWIILAAFMLYLLDDESDSISLPFSFVLGLAMTFLFVNTQRRNLQILQKLTYIAIFASIGVAIYFMSQIHASYRKELDACQFN